MTVAPTTDPAPAADRDDRLELLVRTIRHEAANVMSIELVDPDPDREPLPSYRAGAHIDLTLPNGLERSYSLFERSEGRSYWVAVLNDRNSRGGSAWIHRELRPGMTLPVAPPSNNFALVDRAVPTALIAGGIGITPILAQLRELVEAGNRDVRLLYATRSRPEAAFIDTVDAVAAGGGDGVTVEYHFDEERGGPPDLAAWLRDRQPPRDGHVYCCGPAPMLDAFEAACAATGVPDDCRHIERFSAVDTGPSDDALDHYQVVLQASGITLDMAAGDSILASVRATGIDAAHSCREGVCGSCEVDVIEGVPDHRDGVLSPSERGSNQSMMICVSGSKTPRLVIDL